MRWEEIRRVIDELSTSFTGESYNPVTKNCNSFSNEVISRWIRRFYKTALPAVTQKVNSWLD